MFPTYPAVLRAGHLEWEAAGPPDDPVRVHVTVIAPLAPSSDSGPAMASALAALAAAGGPYGFDDPVEWQKQSRADRVLPTGIQVFELTMDNDEDQDELNRRLRKPGEPEFCVLVKQEV